MINCLRYAAAIKIYINIDFMPVCINEYLYTLAYVLLGIASCGTCKVTVNVTLHVKCI